MFVCFWFLNQDPVRVSVHPRLRNQDFFPKDPSDVEKQLRYTELRLCPPQTERAEPVQSGALTFRRDRVRESWQLRSRDSHSFRDLLSSAMPLI